MLRRFREQRRPLIAGAVAVAAILVITIVALRWDSAEQPAAPRAAPSPSKSAAPPTVAQIYASVVPSLVHIRSDGGPEDAIGTGLVVNADGTIMTAFHVVEGATAIEVTFADGSKSAATVDSADPATDIATLTPKSLPTVVVPAVLGSAAGLNVGDQVVAIGNQLDLTASTTSGIVSGLDRSITREGKAELKGLIQFDAAVNPGSSGGPLVNARGQTVGIVVALANPTKAGTFIGVGFAVPIGTAVGGGGRPPLL